MVSDKNVLPVLSHSELVSNDAAVHILTDSFTLILVCFFEMIWFDFNTTR